MPEEEKTKRRGKRHPEDPPKAETKDLLAAPPHNYPAYAVIPAKAGIRRPGAIRSLATVIYGTMNFPLV